MYVIKVNTDFIEGIGNEIGKITDEIRALSQCTKTEADNLSCLKGFGIDSIADSLYNEADHIFKAADRLDALNRKTAKVCEIYENADNSVKKDVDNLPVLVNGNISESCGRSEFIGKICDESNEGGNITESALLSDNSVIHEDWILKLIARNKYGE